MGLKICARSGTQCVRRRAQILWLCLVAGSGAGGRAATREHGGMDDSPGFADLGLRPQLLEALLELGYEEPTPTQVQTVPPLAAGRDLLGQAPTATGKTASFALPILERLPEGPRGPAPSAPLPAPPRPHPGAVTTAPPPSRPPHQ